ncbi:hypothetical protein RU98_GL000482 [Enterococcus caccae]|nr:hypothetical protein RU98_GL000482 [Enterococcus caccae]
MLSLGEATGNNINIEEINQKHKIIEMTANLEALETVHAIIILEEDINHLSMICELISKIKRKSACYIWIMTVSKNSVGKLVYLQLGADEVFDLNRGPKEITFIMENALLRINQKQEKGISTTEVHSNDKLLKLIPTNVSVLIGGTKEVVLTKLEFQLLELLLRHSGMAVSYDMIYKEMWKDDSEENKQYRIANIVYHLRRKIEKNVKKPIFIKTVRSKGYMLSI